MPVADKPIDTTDQQAVTVAQETLNRLREMIGEDGRLTLKSDVKFAEIGRREVETVCMAIAVLASVSSASAEPVAWCSPGQLANLMDVDVDGGVYLPIRKTERGNFTMPLYSASPEPVPATNQAGEVERLTHVIDRDRYVVAHCLVAINEAVAGRTWLLEGRGPYEWDDDDYRKEFGDALRSIREAAEPLAVVGWDKSDCTRIEERVNAARLAARELLAKKHGPREMILADIFGDPRDLEIARLTDLLATQPATSQEGKRFTSWSTDTLADQCRMQARDQLDPELSSFLAEVADRLAATPTPPTLSEDLREAWNGAVFSAIYGDTSDPFQDPEAYDYASRVADKIRAALAQVKAS